MSDFRRGFLVDAGQVLFTTALPVLSVWGEGRRYDAATGATYAEDGATIATVQNGFGYGSNGQLAVTDIAAGAPADAVAHNGFLFTSAGRLCVDGTNPAAYYKSGLPFATTGGLCASGLVPSGSVVTEGDDSMITEGGDFIVVE